MIEVAFKTKQTSRTAEKKSKKLLGHYGRRTNEEFSGKEHSRLVCKLRIQKTAMKSPIDISTWPRREHFAFFKQYEMPFLGVTAQLDCSRLYDKAKSEGFPFSAGYHFASLRAVNEVEELRCRIEDDLPVENTVGACDVGLGIVAISLIIGCMLLLGNLA
jgi:hypothetical protein